MSGMRIDYSDLGRIVEEGHRAAEARERRRGWLGRALRRLVAWTVVVGLLATAPYFVLVRVGVAAYRGWGLGPWGSVAAGLAATLLVLLAYAWIGGRRLGAGRGVRKLLRRGAIALGVAYVAYAAIYVGGANVKSAEVRDEYRELHPLLRVAASAVFLLDGGRVMTDASRTPEDYWLMGLPVNEASLHFEQEDGYVHALDLRTSDRPEWGNRVVELLFWSLGFHSLRHVGTADHLHVSLRLP